MEYRNSAVFVRVRVIKGLWLVVALKYYRVGTMELNKSSSFFSAILNNSFKDVRARVRMRVRVRVI